MRASQPTSNEATGDPNLRETPKAESPFLSSLNRQVISWIWYEPIKPRIRFADHRRGFRVSCLPVKVERASAGWCRTVAMVPRVDSGDKEDASPA